jgi:hypothetical protein
MADEKKKRQRLGDWQRITKTQQVDGVLGECVYRVLKVTYGNHNWEVADTPEGRKQATEAIHAIRDHEALIAKTQRALAILQEVSDHFANETMGMALSTVADLIDSMKETIHG